MHSSRRDFLVRSSVFAAGFGALRSIFEQPAFCDDLPVGSPYGPLVDDPNGILDLPAGFRYRVISAGGEKMDDGLIVPGKADGMATFPGPDGLTIIVRNHELLPFEGPGAFGASNELLPKVPRDKIYDIGGGVNPHHGGTTTMVFDTRQQKVVRQFLSLAGTTRNCCGGPTPWNSWISCEETVIRPADAEDESCAIDKDHGYCFEVPASAEIALADPVPLQAMGRFNHEAVAVDPETGIIYLTEDREDGLLYRFVPDQPGKLVAGGKLQALRFKEQSSVDTRNWKEQTTFVGQPVSIDWIDLEEIESPSDDLRLRGFESGAARFARGEGMWYSQGKIFFACTNGGKNKTGQIWCLRPAASGGELSLFIEPNNSALLEAADNLTVAPWGDLVVCEDRSGIEVRIVGVTPAGTPYTFGRNHLHTEFAGVVFSPDGSTMFVNLQHSNLTVAITGPWHERTLVN